METPPYRIGRIELTTGVAFDAGALTVAIGPNNGGKTQFLKDLGSAVMFPERGRKSVLTIGPSFPEGVGRVVDVITNEAPLDADRDLILNTIDPDLSRHYEQRLLRRDLDEARSDAGKLRDLVLQRFGCHLIAYLKTDNRLALVTGKEGTGFRGVAVESVIDLAYAASDVSEAWINDQIFAAFGRKLVLDGSTFGRAEYRIGESNLLPVDKADRKRALGQLERLDEQGDGLRAFSGILISLENVRRPVFLIDEPEAFLHPPQAFRIGQAIGQLHARGQQVFVATHSAEVLRGILMATGDVTVVRFSQKDASFSAKILSTADLHRIGMDPLLSSARILDGLFYDGVVVTESDGDVALYRSVMEQLARPTEIHFVNSYGKQLSSKIAAPFRAMGVPNAVIVDFDLLRVEEEFKKIFVDLGGAWAELGSDYSEFIKLAGVANSLESRVATAKELLSKIYQEFGGHGDAGENLTWLRGRLGDLKESTSKWHELKRQGIRCLSEGASSLFTKIDRVCRHQGLFIVPVGQREAWLSPEIPYSNNKNKWTVDALNYLKASPPAAEHLLRQFVEAVSAHCLGSVERKPKLSVGERLFANSVKLNAIVPSAPLEQSINETGVDTELAVKPSQELRQGTARHNLLRSWLRWLHR